MASYLEQTLNPGEKVVLQAQIHPIFLFKPTFWLAVPVFLLLITISAPEIADLTVLPIIIMLPITLYRFIRAALRFMSTELAITNRRILAKVGFIGRRTSELLLASIESIRVDQSALGRLMDYGNVVVIGSGGSSTVFATIERPMRFRATVQKVAPKWAEAMR